MSLLTNKENTNLSTEEIKETLFKVEHLTFGYNLRKKILSDFSIEFKKGDFVVIIGPNGCGKSTLIKSLVRVNLPDSGRIFFKDKLVYRPNPIEFAYLKMKYAILNSYKKYDLSKEIEGLSWFKETKKEYDVYKTKKLGSELAYVPQISNFPDSTTIWDFVKMGRFPHSNMLGINTDKEKENKIISDVLKMVGIYDIKDEEINGVSGGQRQKALIAMSLAQQTDTIILDEPTNHLDIKAQLEIMSLLNRLHKELHKSIILVIHDINMGIKYASTLCVMKDGKLLAQGSPVEVVNSNMLLEAFGVNATVKTETGEIKISDFSLPFNESLKLEKEINEELTDLEENK